MLKSSGQYIKQHVELLSTYIVMCHNVIPCLFCHLPWSTDFKTTEVRKAVENIYRVQSEMDSASTLPHLETTVKSLWSYTGNNSIIAAISLFRTHLSYSYLAFSAFPKQSGDLSFVWFGAFWKWETPISIYIVHYAMTFEEYISQGNFKTLWISCRTQKGLKDTPQRGTLAVSPDLGTKLTTAFYPPN